MIKAFREFLACLVMPCSTSPHLGTNRAEFRLPRQSRPFHADARRALPAMLRLALPNLVAPRLTVPALPLVATNDRRPVTPHHVTSRHVCHVVASLRLAQPGRAMPCQTTPCLPSLAESNFLLLDIEFTLNFYLHLVKRIIDFREFLQVLILVAHPSVSTPRPGAPLLQIAFFSCRRLN